MSAVQPIAIAVADLHLSLLRPACRADDNWLDVQAHYLEEMTELATGYGVPVLCAGDIFDRWNPPPELINFALQHLPHEMICVPGNHDLPLHRLDQIHRSGYGVLEEAGKIIDITREPCYVEPEQGDFVVKGFGCGMEITEPHYESLKMPLTPQIALIHRYCWTEGKSYPGAPEECHVYAYKKVLKGYNVAIFGDCHRSFQGRVGDCYLVNCGTFIRRKSDEMNHQPSAAIIYSDGTVKRHKLNTSIDVFHENPEKREEVAIDMKAFIDRLESLGEHGLNFVEAVETALRDGDYDEETKEIILSCVDNKGEK